MRQLEIEFFWPLTEQIPLDLDYSECIKPKLYTTNTVTVTSGGTGLAYTNSGTITSSFTIDSEITKVVLPEEPGFIRKMAYKILGLKWGTK